MPGSTAVRIVLFAWMAVPPLLFEYGWLLALNPNNGFVTHIVNGILGDWAPAPTPNHRRIRPGCRSVSAAYSLTGILPAQRVNCVAPPRSKCARIAHLPQKRSRPAGAFLPERADLRKKNPSPRG